MAQLGDFFPELCQVRSMLENKLAEVQSKVKRDHGWKQFLGFVIFQRRGMCWGWICETGINLGFVNFGVLLPPLPHLRMSLPSPAPQDSDIWELIFRCWTTSHQHGLPAVSRYHCQRPPRIACYFEEESLTLYRCIWC